jgi:hypothetical protein
VLPDRRKLKVVLPDRDAAQETQGNGHPAIGGNLNFIYFLLTSIRLLFNADSDPDPDFHFYDDPDPDFAPYQSDGNPRLLVCRPSRAPFLSLQSSIVKKRPRPSTALFGASNASDPDPDLMRIRIRQPPCFLHF